jgi:hypothetical protein
MDQPHVHQDHFHGLTLEKVIFVTKLEYKERLKP